MSGRVATMTAADVKIRAGHAHSFLSTLRLVQELGSDAEIDDTDNIVGSLAVLAGIAASDAMCGRALGQRSVGESHADAVRLLSQLRRGAPLASDLKRLLGEKSNSQYSPRYISADTARRMAKWAQRLVSAMDDVLAG